MKRLFETFENKRKSIIMKAGRTNKKRTHQKKQKLYSRQLEGGLLCQSLCFFFVVLLLALMLLSCLNVS